jgi:hypothetical protein
MSLGRLPGTPSDRTKRYRRQKKKKTIFRERRKKKDYQVSKMHAVCHISTMYSAVQKAQDEKIVMPN